MPCSVSGRLTLPAVRGPINSSSSLRERAHLFAPETPKRRIQGENSSGLSRFYLLPRSAKLSTNEAQKYKNWVEIVSFHKIKILAHMKSAIVSTNRWPSFKTRFFGPLFSEKCQKVQQLKDCIPAC